MKYTVERSCGCVETVELFGNSDYRKWKLKQYEETPCQDCQRKEEQEKAKRQADEEGLPELTGTEKQIAWALTIRGAYLKDFKERYNNMIHTSDGDEREMREKKYAAIYEVICSATSAHWWINNRNLHITLLPEQWEDDKDRFREAAIDAELVMVPEGEPRNHAPIKIVVGTDEVLIKTYLSDRAYEIAKDHRFFPSSNGMRHEINNRTGSAQERAAEMMYAFLKGGYRVTCGDEEARRRCVEGDFEEEWRKWIRMYTEGEHKGKFAVSLVDGMYEKAKRIAGARYCKPDVAVPLTSWRELSDFADLYGYRWTDLAIQYKEAQEAAEIKVALKDRPSGAKDKEDDQLAEILNSSRDILPDLIDD